MKKNSQKSRLDKHYIRKRSWKDSLLIILLIYLDSIELESKHYHQDDKIELFENTQQLIKTNSNKFDNFDSVTIVKRIQNDYDNSIPFITKKNFSLHRTKTINDNNSMLLNILIKQFISSLINKRIINQVSAIRLIRLDAPQTVQAGQSILLRCLTDSKRDRLQSLSWYKNGREFYRYQPFDRAQSVLIFNLTGINVDTKYYLLLTIIKSKKNSKSRNNTVLLTNTTSETSGRYKCEVTGLSFQEAHMETYINVITPGSGGTYKLQNEKIYINHFMITIITIYLIFEAFIF